MTGQIVVGVVPTPAGDKALEWATRRAIERRAPLLLVSVVVGAIGAVGEGAVVDAALAEATEQLEARAETARGAGATVETAVRRGNPTGQLAEASAGAALLVIGSDYRGPSGPARGVRGVRIAAGSACPVVVVPDADLGGRSGVVVGVDGSPTSEAAIAFAAAEADRLGEPLIAVAAWMPIPVPLHQAAYPEGYLGSMQALTEETLAMSLAGLRQDYPDLEVRRHVERGYASEVINGHAASARLAVVGSHGRGPVARLFLGSVSHEVLTRLATATAIVR